MSDRAEEEQNRFSKTMGVIFLGHGELTVEEMKERLRALSPKLGGHRWKIVINGNKFLTFFPSKDGQELAASKSSIPCKDYKVDSEFNGVEGMKMIKYTFS